MAGDISKNWRVLVAVLFAASLVVGAYFTARGIQSPHVAQASDETALLQAIATKDSDNDGLSDWEEALYGTDPHMSDTFSLGMTDGDAVAHGLIVPKAIAGAPTPISPLSPTDADGLPPAPADGTLTATFTKNFFTLFVKARQDAGGADLTEAQMNDVANQTLDSLASVIAPTPDYKTMKDIRIAGSGADALKAFAVNAENILVKNTSTATSSDLEYLHAAVVDNDSAALAHIASLAKMYRGSAAGLAALLVPQELAEADLQLVNALMRMSEIDSDFTKVESDPLVVILAIKQYMTVATSLRDAFVRIGELYAAQGISLPKGAPGAGLVNMISRVDARVQSAATKP